MWSPPTRTVAAHPSASRVAPGRHPQASPAPTGSLPRRWSAIITPTSPTTVSSAPGGWRQRHAAPEGLSRWHALHSPSGPHAGQTKLPHRPHTAWDGRPCSPHSASCTSTGLPAEAPAPASPGRGERGKGRGRLTWAALLKRVFDADVFVCTACGGRRRVVAVLTGPGGVGSLLRHLGLPDVPLGVAPARGLAQEAWQH
jgi:hypothetical protein